MTTTDILWGVLRIVLIFSAVMGLVAYMTLMERRFLGFFQLRLGPTAWDPGGCCSRSPTASSSSSRRT